MIITCLSATKELELRQFVKKLIAQLRNYKAIEIETIKTANKKKLQFKIGFRSRDRAKPSNKYADTLHRVYYVVSVGKVGGGFRIRSEILDKTTKKTQTNEFLLGLARTREYKKMQNKIYKNPMSAFKDWLFLPSQFIRYGFNKRKELFNFK